MSRFLILDWINGSGSAFFEYRLQNMQKNHITRNQEYSCPQSASRYFHQYNQELENEMFPVLMLCDTTKKR